MARSANNPYSEHQLLLAIRYALAGFCTGGTRREELENDAEIGDLQYFLAQLDEDRLSDDIAVHQAVHTELLDIWYGPVQDLIFYHHCDHPGRSDDELHDAVDLWDLDLTIAIAEVYEALLGIYVAPDMPLPEERDAQIFAYQAAQLVARAEEHFKGAQYGHSYQPMREGIHNVYEQAVHLSHQWRLTTHTAGLFHPDRPFAEDTPVRWDPTYWLNDDGELERDA
jgi:hypothetical protein